MKLKVPLHVIYIGCNPVAILYKLAQLKQHSNKQEQFTMSAKTKEFGICQYVIQCTIHGTSLKSGAHTSQTHHAWASEWQQ